MRITRGVLGRAPLCLFLISCGTAEGGQAGAAATVLEPVLSGTTDITENLWSVLVFQAETDSIVTLSGHRYVAYNNDDPGYINYFGSGASQYRVACGLASMMGYSMYNASTNTWSKNKVPIGGTWAMLWGDPAISVIPGTNRVFLSNIASPLDRFLAAANVQGNQCGDSGTSDCCPFGDQGIRNDYDDSTVYPKGMGPDPHVPPQYTSALAGACIARATAPNSFTLSESDCVRSGNDFFDGGSLAGAGSFMYAAYLNDTQHKIFVYRATSTGAWTPSPPNQGSIPIPFPGKTIGGHPLLLNGVVSNVYLIGRDDNAVLWITELAGGSLLWSPPVQVLTNCNFMDPVTLKDNTTKLRTRGYTAIRSASGVIDVACQTPGTAPRTMIKGTRCSGTPLVCTPWTAVTSPSNDSFMPVLGIAYNDQFAPLIRLTYWANNNLSGAQVRMRRWDYVNGGVGYAAPPAQTVCADLREDHNGNPLGYWGDYDAIFVTENGTSHPTLWRSITDSTSFGCVRNRYNAVPQHVSLLPITL